MAPKHKSTLSQNLLCFGASSSFDPTPSSVQFHDENAWKDFSENFCRQGIHLKCHVVLLDFSNTDLPTVIHSRGWESLCGIPVTCPLVIIHEFYCNMHEIDTSVPHFFSHVRDTCIVVTPKDSVWGQCPKTNSCLAFVRHLHLGVTVKTPLARAL